MARPAVVNRRQRREKEVQEVGLSPQPPEAFFSLTTRRQFIAGSAGLAAAGVTVRAVDQGLFWPFDRPALAAWSDWQRYQGALGPVAGALLAPSPHNSQPWRFALGQGGIDLFEVPARGLGVLDPFGRERLAALGAALQTMVLAATGVGAIRVRLMPDPGDAAHIARVVLVDGPPPPPHPLRRAIARRHTHRGAWTGAPLRDADRALLATASPWPDVRVLLFAAGSGAGKRFATLTAEATDAIAGDAEMATASHRWFRHGRRDEDAHKDGLTLATAGLPEPMRIAATLLPPVDAATAAAHWSAATRDTMLPTASLFGLILVADPWDRGTALRAGAVWQRLHLGAAAIGIAAQPLNQLPEMIDRERALGSPPRFARAATALLPDPALRPTFGFRLGHAETPAGRSLRRPVGDVIGAPARLEFDVEEERRRGLRLPLQPSLPSTGFAVEGLGK